MRMWGVPANLLCQKHLLGEHVEMHMFVGTINKGVSIKGYIERGLVDPSRIVQRHEELSAEMISRGMNHQSPLSPYPDGKQHLIDIEGNKQELIKRCPDCKKRIEGI